MFIQVPDKAIDDNKVSNGALLTLGMIISLSKSKIGCIAKNKYFAKRFHCEVRTIQNHLEELRLHEYITIEETPIFNSEDTRRSLVPTKNILLSAKEVKQEVKKLDTWRFKNKNLLPKDIESDWLDDYIANIE